MTMKERIIEAIESMPTDEAMPLWNNYCDEANRMDDCIYSMADFDEYMQDMLPWEIARAAYYSGNFCPAHDYFWFNGYGNLESSDYPDIDSKSPFCKDEIASWIVDNENALYCDDIQEILDNEEMEV